MRSIVKVSLDKVSVNWTSTKMNTRMVTFSDGGYTEVANLLREIGNNGFDNWINVNKISKSTSDKNIAKYLNKFIDQLYK